MKDGEMFIPDTVGEMIELLKKFPADYDINFYIRNVYDNGSVYDESAYRMKVPPEKGGGFSFSSRKSELPRPQRCRIFLAICYCK